MVARQLMTALIVGGMIGIWVREWKETRRARERARSILYPGDPSEMAKVIAELKRYRDPESQVLTRQLEERLEKRGRRRWWWAH